jgi:hypothetical protein
MSVCSSLFLCYVFLSLCFTSFFIIPNTNPIIRMGLTSSLDQTNSTLQVPSPLTQYTLLFYIQSLSLFLCISLSFHLSLSTSLFPPLSFHLSLSTSLFPPLSFHLSLSLSVSQSASLSFSLFLSLFIYLSVSRFSVSFSTCLSLLLTRALSLFNSLFLFSLSLIISIYLFSPILFLMCLRPLQVSLS